MKISNSNTRIAVVGLGYVGLPLAVEFSKKIKTIGYDINRKRIVELREFNDSTKEVDSRQLINVFKNNNFSVTYNVREISKCNVYIICVPTPIDLSNKPFLEPLFRATKLVASILKKNDIVIYESTVYPGLTENECGPILEKESNLILNKDFFLGYSPERINPGDKQNTLTKIKKITSGSTNEAALFVDNLYKKIIKAGTHLASTIQVAEAAKVIENSQRDINIAFVNELSKIFKLLNIDTNSVLEAASTKWNFLNFKPGLVGGHCIGVDPFYLAQKAQEVGYHPEIILAGRRVNDSMGKYIAIETIKKMINKKIQIAESKILIMGFTFKENCPDVRNSKVNEIYKELKTYGICVDVFDPIAIKDDVLIDYGIKLLNTSNLDFNNYSAIIIAVAHDCFRKFNFSKSENKVIFDVKNILPYGDSDLSL
jgi:UDP-N-acetyl-D-galactosamine dehydrogenase